MKELSEPTNGVAGMAEKPKSIKAKPPLPLPLCFMLSHLEEDGPVRLDGVKLGVCEVMGLELDEPKLGAFAGALNALDFPAQLLVRQHPPGLKRLRQDLQEAQPDSLPPQTKAASESLRRLLTDLEKRDGILDRRFYAVCEFARRVRRGRARRGGDQPPRHARRRDPRPVAAPGQVAPVPGPRLPAKPHGGGSADGPVRPPGADSRRAGGADP